MAARRVAPLAALLVLLPAALPPPAQAQGVTAELAALEAGYGLETWKEEAPVGDALRGVPLPVPPGGALGVYENPYLDPTRPRTEPRAWLGHNLTAVVEVRGDGGGPDATGTLSIGARLETLAGAIPAKLARLSPTRFAAQFDLDGENGAWFPEAPPGPARLVVEVNRTAGNPLVEPPRRVATAEFPLTLVAAALDRGGLRFDEAALPGYADVGPGNQTLLQAELLPPGEAFTVTASLGVPDARAALVAWHRGERTFRQEARTDAQGRFALQLDPAELAGGNASALVVLAAHLTGGDGVLGAAQVALPVSPNVTRIARFAFAPVQPPRSEPLQEGDMVIVAVDEPGAPGSLAATGNVTVLDPAGTIVTSAPLLPPDPLAPGAERTARIPALLLREAGLSQYRVVALLLAEGDRLYSLAQGLRGFAVGGAGAEARPFEEGALPVVVRNFNNNFDGRPDEGMRLDVRLRITGLPGDTGRDAQVSVEESGEQRLSLPFRGEAGQYPVLVNATADELVLELQGLVTIAEPPRGFLGLPGFEAALLALALLAGLAQRRRTRS